MFAIIWKGIMLKWIHVVWANYSPDGLCEYEFPNIDEFYKVYRDKLETRLNPLLQSFLTEKYPKLDVEFAPCQSLSNLDYIYVYAVLLHFACEEMKSLTFRAEIIKLPEKHQTIINKFLDVLANESNTSQIDRNRLTKAVEAAIASYPEISLIECFECLKCDKFFSIVPPNLNEIIKETNLKLEQQQIQCIKLVSEIEQEKVEVEQKLKKHLNVLEQENSELKLQILQLEQIIESPICTSQTNQVKTHFEKAINKLEKDKIDLNEMVLKCRYEITSLSAQLKQCKDGNMKLSRRLESVESEMAEEVRFLNNEVAVLKDEKENLLLHYNELRKLTQRRRLEHLNFKKYSSKSNKFDAITSSPLDDSVAPPLFGALCKVSTIKTGSTEFNDTHEMEYLFSGCSSFSTYDMEIHTESQKNLFNNTYRSLDEAYSISRGHRSHSTDNNLPLSLELKSPIRFSDVGSSTGQLMSENVRLLNELWDIKRETETIKVEFEKVESEVGDLRRLKTLIVRVPSNHFKSLNCTIL